ncbi:MAG: hypothetical protein IIA45_05175 [Bacteroidetes bacterium]|nr:hypothetical protein [Bacteroidota bacterium]
MTNIFRVIHDIYDRKKHLKESVIIGVNGSDCSGKTYFSRSLKEYFIDIGVSSVVVDIDEFNVKAVEDDTYESFSKKQFTKQHLETYYTQIIDFKLAHKKILELRDNYSVLIIEGIFIYKKELVKLFDFKVFLETDYPIAIERFRSRQKRNKNSRQIGIFENIWLPSHKRYLKEVGPENLSDLLIDNSDYSKPEIIGSSSTN